MNFDMKNWKDGAAVGATLATLMVTHTLIMATFSGVMRKWEEAKRKAAMKKHLAEMEAHMVAQQGAEESAAFENEDDYAEAA